MYTTCVTLDSCFFVHIILQRAVPVFGIALISLYTHLAVSQRGGDGGEREADADERGETPQQEPEGAAERPQA